MRATMTMEIKPPGDFTVSQCSSQCLVRMCLGRSRIMVGSHVLCERFEEVLCCSAFHIRTENSAKIVHAEEQR